MIKIIDAKLLAYAMKQLKPQGVRVTMTDGGVLHVNAQRVLNAKNCLYQAYHALVQAYAERSDTTEWGTTTVVITIVDGAPKRSRCGRIEGSEPESAPIGSIISWDVQALY